MIAFPNAKINIGLNILGKRTDGYHDIFSCFYPIKWCDVLEIIESRELDFYTSGIDIPGNKSDNLCIKAYELLKQDYDIPPVNIYLHKVIPMGAGLGGGSADAAFTLKLLNQKFDLKLSNKDLERYAGRLGSDCTFFINNKPAIATERGQILKPHLLDLSDYYCVLINPSIHQSTAEAYNSVNFSKPVGNIEEILSESQIESWQKRLSNDFEYSLFKRFPELQILKDSLKSHGAVYASMTGSGSTIYGIFKEEISLSHFMKEGYTTFQISM